MPDRDRPQVEPGTSVRVTRAIAADPTSTALLLAGPTAMDLWPGLRRIGEQDGRVLVETGLSAVGDPATGHVRALPPRRTPTSYVTHFEVTGLDRPSARGTLTLGYAPAAGDGLVNTRAVLDLEVDGPVRAATGQSHRQLRASSVSFLDNLAWAAEARSHAA